jgi:phage baseplate assembly protein gpV
VSAAALFDSISRIARHEASARPAASVGVVTSIFPNEGAHPDHAVTVELRDSKLVLPRVPVAVSAMGFAAIPAIGDLVLVVFTEGDYHAPVVVGRIYTPDVEPPKHKDGQLVLRLPAGEAEAAFNCEVTGDPAVVKVAIGTDVTVEWDKEKVSFKAGDLRVSINGAGGGRIEVAAGGSSMTLKKDGDVSIKTTGKLKLEANEIEIAGQAKVKLNSAVVELN